MLYLKGVHGENWNVVLTSTVMKQIVQYGKTFQQPNKRQDFYIPYCVGTSMTSFFFWPVVQARETLNMSCMKNIQGSMICTKICQLQYNALSKLSKTYRNWGKWTLRSVNTADLYLFKLNTDVKILIQMYPDCDLRNKHEVHL